MTRPVEARINTQALRANATLARELAPGARVMAVVKANAYGHGSVLTARALRDNVDAFAVASMEEAVELRDADITAPILLLQGVFEPRELGVAAGLGLWLMVQNEAQVRWLLDANLPARVHCWLKVDTGMNRLGVTPAAVPGIIEQLAGSANCHDDVVLCTHFAAADNPADSRTAAQLTTFGAIRFEGPRSAANSAGVLAWPHSHLDWVRPGYMLYGLDPLVASHPAPAGLRPAMTLVSRITAIRDVARGDAVGYGGTWVARRPSRIATVTCGYGDGYPRQARNGTPVLVHGQRAALAGRVSMDTLTLDVTDIPGTALGDEVTLWGDGLPVTEVAPWAGTIGYELTTRMPARVLRRATQD
ncbi:MAG: alanine racemase [Halioglobus sp.]|nr:alanine racemase [Halioglobus sp.]